MLKKDKEIYFKFFLTFVLFFFVLTYAVVNQDSIGKQVEIIVDGSSLFVKTTSYQFFKPESFIPSYNDQTYEIERLIFMQINEVREEDGLSKLEWDPLLAKLARDHSYDMALNGYTNHTNLFGDGPTERAELLGIRTRIRIGNKIYTGVSENIGFMPQGIVQDVGVLITEEDLTWGMIYKWMLSEPHRDNILDDELFVTGIGVAFDGKGNYYITQDFQ
jgi:uncharacterized protein YkwD